MIVSKYLGWLLSTYLSGQNCFPEKSLVFFLLAAGTFLVVSQALRQFGTCMRFVMRPNKVVQTAILRNCQYRESHRSSDHVPTEEHSLFFWRWLFSLCLSTQQTLFLVIICWQMFQDFIFRVWSTWCFLLPTAHPHWSLIYWTCYSSSGLS